MPNDDRYSDPEMPKAREPGEVPAPEPEHPVDRDNAPDADVWQDPNWEPTPEIREKMEREQVLKDELEGLFDAIMENAKSRATEKPSGIDFPRVGEITPFMQEQEEKEAQKWLDDLEKQAREELEREGVDLSKPPEGESDAGSEAETGGMRALVDTMQQNNELLTEIRDAAILVVDTLNTMGEAEDVI